MKRGSAAMTINLNRRKFLKTSAASTATAAGLFPRLSSAQSGDKIRIGTIQDLSGFLQPFGTQKKRCLDLATDEVNGNGGLLGKQLELISYDSQSNDQLYAQFATQLAHGNTIYVLAADYNFGQLSEKWTRKI